MQQQTFLETKIILASQWTDRWEGETESQQQHLCETHCSIRIRLNAFTQFISLCKTFEIKVFQRSSSELLKIAWIIFNFSLLWQQGKHV